MIGWIQGLDCLWKRGVRRLLCFEAGGEKGPTRARSCSRWISGRRGSVSALLPSRIGCRTSGNWRGMADRVVLPFQVRGLFLPLLPRRKDELLVSYPELACLRQGIPGSAKQVLGRTEIEVAQLTALSSHHWRVHIFSCCMGGAHRQHVADWYHCCDWLKTRDGKYLKPRGLWLIGSGGTR